MAAYDVASYCLTGLSGPTGEEKQPLVRIDVALGTHDARAQEEGEEQLVLLEQAAADVAV